LNIKFEMMKINFVVGNKENCARTSSTTTVSISPIISYPVGMVVEPSAPDTVAN
jgi:hypothetical protein